MSTNSEENLRSIEIDYNKEAPRSLKASKFKLIKENVSAILSVLAIILNIIVLSYIIPQLRDDISKDTGKVELLTDQLNTINSQTTQLQTSVSNSEGKLEVVQRQNENSINTTSSLSTLIGSVKASVDIVNSQIPSMQNNLNNLNGQLDVTNSLFTQIINNKTQVQDVLDNLILIKNNFMVFNDTITKIQNDLAPINQTFTLQFIQDNNAFNKIANFVTMTQYVTQGQNIFNNLSVNVENLKLSFNTTIIHFGYGPLGGYAGNPNLGILTSYDVFGVNHGILGWYWTMTSPYVIEVINNGTHIFTFYNNAHQHTCVLNTTCVPTGCYSTPCGTGTPYFNYIYSPNGLCQNILTSAIASGSACAFPNTFVN